jgi:peptidyl-prolyl cis-trans isomerase SurA
MKSVMLKLRITIIILLLCVFLDTSHAAILLDRVVAVVNKEVITWSELYRMMEYEATDQVKALKEDERRKIFRDNEAVFLERLIDTKLQIQEARKLGLDVTTEEVTGAIENIKKKYSMTDTDFTESLAKEGLTLDEYKRRLSEQIIISKVVSQQIRNKIVVSDADVKKYIEANMKVFNEGEAYKLRRIFFKKPKNDEDKKAVEERASLIIQKLKAGEDFSILAKEYSEDPLGKIGGELGLIKKSDMAREFIDVLSTMKAGDFSMPFWTEKGLHIIKLDEKVSPQSITEVAEEARRHLTESQFVEKYKSWIKSLREKAFVEIRL